MYICIDAYTYVYIYIYIRIYIYIYVYIANNALVAQTSSTKPNSQVRRFSFPKGGRPENLKFGMEGVASHQSSWMSSPKLAPCANSYGCKQLPPTSSPVRTRAYVATAKCPVEKLDNITSRSRMVKWLHC